jgi:dTDP-glucose 4,6-dehydratase
LRAVVLGAAGFLGRHLSLRLLGSGWGVVAVDNLSTGTADAARQLEAAGAEFLLHDATTPLRVGGRVDAVAHLASPASPPAYLARPLDTLRAGSAATENALVLAARKSATMLLASTSEVYGDPQVSPQPETYRGNVDPTGPRSVYDEAKRYAEAMATAFSRVHGTAVRIARIFNTYGPGMRHDDGRAVPEFFLACREGRPLPVHGDGLQTRSMCYVEDTIRGLEALLTGPAEGPVNIGNPDEVTVLELAWMVQEAAGVEVGHVLVPRPEDDPGRRCPDIGRARRELGWSPRVGLSYGLRLSAPWFLGS